MAFSSNRDGLFLVVYTTTPQVVYQVHLQFLARSNSEFRSQCVCLYSSSIVCLLTLVMVFVFVSSETGFVIDHVSLVLETA